MKKSLCFLLLASLLTTTLFAQKNAYYTVLVGNFIDAKPQDFDNIRSLGFLVGNQMNGNQYQIQLAGFDTKSAADQVSQQLRAMGYSSAYTQTFPIDQGQTSTVIQIATRDLTKDVEWEKFELVGPLFALVNGSQVKIVTGTYPDVNTAKQQLTSIRNSGYSDAFIKRVNSSFLHPVTEFSTGIKKPLIPISFNNTRRPATTEIPQVPTSFDQIPPSYGTVTPRTPNASATYTSNSRGAAGYVPSIRSTVKRRSVLELQKILKAQNTYAGKLDGYYGNGTESAYQAAMSSNHQLQKYKLLGERLDYNATTTAANSSRLQQAINSLHTDPVAPSIIESSTLPIARAYQAYILYNSIGPSSEVNSLMNTAIREAYATSRFRSQPPFDYQATYAYQDLGQLILHLHYIHSAPGTNFTAPCWFFQKHPQETARTYEAYANMASPDFHLQACDQFLNWDEVKTLQAVATDLNGDAIMDQGKLSAAASRRSKLFLAPQQMTQGEINAFEAWNNTIWSRLNAWALRDPLHDKLVSTLKVAYFQSQVRLEDYYMDKGFNSQQATGLALATLQSLVGYHLERFSV